MGNLKQDLLMQENRVMAGQRNVLATLVGESRMRQLREQGKR